MPSSLFHFSPRSGSSAIISCQSRSTSAGGNLSGVILVHALLLRLIRSFRTVSPCAWRHVEMRTERLVEIRQVVESPPISDFRNVQRLLVRITQRVAAALKPVFEQPVTE